MIIAFPVRCEGQTCEVDINECVKSPCGNGATCFNTVGGYHCKCLPGFSGQRCETDVDDCTPSTYYSQNTQHPFLMVVSGDSDLRFWGQTLMSVDLE